MITVDDIVHIISEEAGEDILRLSGAGDGDINEPIHADGADADYLARRQSRHRDARRLGGRRYSRARSRASRLLAVLMPIVSGMGGNAGTQTLAVVVRALATNQLTSSNTARMILREFRIAAANGAMLGVLVGSGTYLAFGNTGLAIVIAMAMIINNLVAGLAGVLVPVSLERAGVDPAVSSAVFVTTMTDVMGFLSFLGLATLWGLGG